nr:RNA-directed DNA polymerase, eukaryota [Tanacetum cinerariifolium]
MHRKRPMEVNGSFPVGVHGPSISSASVLVLDDSCVAERDVLNHVMGKVKDVSSISNLRTLIMEEGFSVVNLVYLGGLWVMIECDNVETKANMLQHTGVKSWFHVLQNAVYDFVSDERIVWVDIEGIPLNVWSRETFTRIGKNGERRWILKIMLIPLLGVNEMEYTSDEDSDVGPQKVPDHSQFCEEGPNDDRSEDPFNIYRLLRKQPGDDSHEVSSSLSYPSGFTPDVSVIQNENGQSTKEIPVVVNAKVMNNSQYVYKEASCDNVDPNVVKKGGSVLGVMEDMIRVGKAMGYLMDGCVKDLEQIIGTQGVGNSGAIFCVWEATVFKKDYATISENFVAIYGTWLPSNSKVLFVAIYAPQQVSKKRILWDYVSTLIDRQNGEISLEGFDAMVEQTWWSFSHNDANRMIRFKKKIQELKVRIRAWIKDKRSSVFGEKDSIKKELSDTDRHLDGGDVSDSNLLRRSELHRNIGTLLALIYVTLLSIFFKNESFPNGCNSSFVALILKITDAKFVNDFRPISLIGSVYKVVTKVLANRFALVILDLISDTQSAFVANRKILDGPFILNELLHCFAKASVLVNGSLTIEVPFHCGLKQGDPLSPYLFILIMESFNMSFTRAIDEGVFKGVHLHGSTSISHLFYADDVMFIGEWSDDNLKGIINILQCFFLASGLKINIEKSQVLRVGVPSSIVMQAASLIGCGVLHMQFRYLGHNAWASTVDKLRSRLSKWKVKTLSIGGRLTLLKAVLGASHLYNMSIFKFLKEF